MLGDGRVAIALDDMHGDAKLVELGDVHVARRPGAEKDDVAEIGTSPHRLGRQIGVVVEADLIASEQARDIGAVIGLMIDVDLRIVGAAHTLENRRELLVAVEEQRFHRRMAGEGNRREARA